MNAAKKAPDYPSEIAALPESERQAALDLYLEGRYRQDSLSLRINAGVGLSAEDIDDLVDILGKRCQERTRRMLRRALSCVPDIACFSSYERLHFDKPHGWSYCAGQDYRAEVPRLRKRLISN